LHRSQPLTPKDYLLTDSDVEIQILWSVKELETSGIKVKFAHVKGHQDNNTEFTNLSRPAQLNVLADRLASKRLLNKTICPYYHLPASQIMLFIKGTAITAGYKYFIRNAYLTPNLRAYMIKKFKWSPTIPDKIWWQPHGMAVKSLGNPMLTRIQKWIFYHLPTNQRSFIIHKHGTATCPVCGIEDEDDDHVIRCNCPHRSKIRKDWIEALYTYLDTTTHTPKEMTRCIMRGITMWMLQQEAPHINQISYMASDTLTKAYNEQTLIGWNHFIRGRISVEWGAMMRYTYQILNKNNSRPDTKTNKRKFYTPESWAKGLITLNWKFANLLWEDRINTVTKNSNTTIADNHYFLLQKAYHKLEHHRIHNPNDLAWVIKSQDELSKFSSNHLKVWINNLDLLNKLNDNEQ
jgi:hypothetical protein